ncbi:[FeFe] hydrogenase H-cluster radical SAM maturase HydE [bacterium]|nr:[FeFe] hydrogenase H-cluster radical SAM maturase HydE [bacterium]
MVPGLSAILDKKDHDRSDILAMLQCSDEEVPLLFRRASAVRDMHLGSNVFLRGLIEYSNICGKNCLYCSIRRENHEIDRYTLTKDEVIEAVMTAHRLNFGSISLQSGGNSSQEFTDNIEDLIRTIRQMTGGRMGITLSLGEQTRETYQRWHEAGAHRYLLRIEAASEALFRRVHPGDDMQSYYRRLECLKIIKETGYHTGTGLVVGLPFQTMSHLADDIIFMRDFDVDMCCLGPFIEHSATLSDIRNGDNLFMKERFNLTLRMIAIIRIVMKDINIITATSIHAVDPAGREKAISCGANVVMPNLTPAQHRHRNQVHNGKPRHIEINETNISGLDFSLLPGMTLSLGLWGDTPHYSRRLIKN